MPTGYTAGIADDVTFNEFVMSCALGMGALVMMREEPMNAQIPEMFEPSDYNTKIIAETTAALERLDCMTIAEAEQAASAAYEIVIAEQAKAVHRNDTLREKYTAMLEKVEAWQPPSEDHNGLKEFMVEQIISSINYDCGNYYRDQKHKKITGAEWKKQEETRLHKDMAYHEAENTKEVERTEARNNWLRKLRESLKAANVKLTGRAALTDE